MYKKILFITVLTLMLTSCFAGEKDPVKLEHLNMETFKEKIFDFEVNKKWDFKGELPAIIDFYADWCAPCRKVAPIMKELSEEYEGKIVIYKIDTAKQRELAGMFGIRSIPSILFIPKEGQPQMITGALPKEEFVRLIKEVLSVQ